LDVTDFWNKKVEVLQCYGSQFYNPESAEPATPISGEEFFEFLYGKALALGRPCGFKLGEGFIADRYLGVDNLGSVR
jgi:hypothetical protein